MMINKTLLPWAMLLGTGLVSGCEVGYETGLVPYRQGPDTVIATSHDTGIDKIGLQDGGGAIAYDPDGCQGWIIDDGVEGYSGRRYDPISGLPVCNNLYPPGTVVRNYQSDSTGLKDYVPGRAAN